MDPGFLRRAVGDANGERRVELASFAALRLRGLTAAHAWAAAVRRHLHTSNRAESTVESAIG